MNTRKLAIAALVLWGITIAVFGVFFVRGHTAKGSDNRTAVILNASERSLILAEMRGLLDGVQKIVEGLNRHDIKQIEQAAHAVGMNSAADVNPLLMAKLPLPFKQLGMSVHHDMDDLAAAAQAGKPSTELQGMLANTLTKCVACHTAWQLQATN
jgi:cytochrome c556